MAMVSKFKRFDVYLVNLEPTIGSEIKKTRPCIIISPDEMNKYLNMVLIAPMTSQGKGYPTRIPCHFDGKDGSIALDQIRTIDNARLYKRLGSMDSPTNIKALEVLRTMLRVLTILEYEVGDYFTDCPHAF